MADIIEYKPLPVDEDTEQRHPLQDDGLGNHTTTASKSTAWFKLAPWTAFAIGLVFGSLLAVLYHLPYIR
jgi:hypothetical protein